MRVLLRLACVAVLLAAATQAASAGGWARSAPDGVVPDPDASLFTSSSHADLDVTFRGVSLSGAVVQGIVAIRSSTRVHVRFRGEGRYPPASRITAGGRSLALDWTDSTRAIPVNYGGEVLFDGEVAPHMLFVVGNESACLRLPWGEASCPHGASRHVPWLAVQTDLAPLGGRVTVCVKALVDDDRGGAPTELAISADSRPASVLVDVFASEGQRPVGVQLLRSDDNPGVYSRRVQLRELSGASPNVVIRYMIGPDYADLSLPRAVLEGSPDRED